ncbi:2OG-Fe(II) oxygenase [Glycomyces sp. NPDC047369]
MHHPPWDQRGPFVIASVLDEDLVARLLAALKAGQAKPRSYQGVVDLTERDCSYVEVPQALAEEVNGAIGAHVAACYGVETAPMENQPQLIYSYGEGVGFVAHHDEVTDIERERAADTGQPVIGGDVTCVLFLTGPDQYAGGELFFEDPAMEVRPAAGALVTFPATRTFMHGVNRISAGERITLLARRTTATA